MSDKTVQAEPDAEWTARFDALLEEIGWAGTASAPLGDPFSANGVMYAAADATAFLCARGTAAQRCHRHALCVKPNHVVLLDSFRSGDGRRQTWQIGFRVQRGATADFRGFFAEGVLKALDAQWVNPKTVAVDEAVSADGLLCAEGDCGRSSVPLCVTPPPGAEEYVLGVLTESPRTDVVRPVLTPIRKDRSLGVCIATGTHETTVLFRMAKEQRGESIKLIGGRRQVHAGGMGLDGRVGLYQRDRNGYVRRYALIAGRWLEIHEGCMVDSTQPGSFSVLIENDRVRIAAWLKDAAEVRFRLPPVEITDAGTVAVSADGEDPSTHWRVYVAQLPKGDSELAFELLHPLANEAGARSTLLEGNCLTMRGSFADFQINVHSQAPPSSPRLLPVMPGCCILYCPPLSAECAQTGNGSPAVGEHNWLLLACQSMRIQQPDCRNPFSRIIRERDPFTVRPLWPPSAEVAPFDPQNSLQVRAPGEEPLLVLVTHSAFARPLELTALPGGAGPGQSAAEFEVEVSRESDYAVRVLLGQSAERGPYRLHVDGAVAADGLLPVADEQGQSVHICVDRLALAAGRHRLCIQTRNPSQAARGLGSEAELVLVDLATFAAAEKTESCLRLELAGRAGRCLVAVLNARARQTMESDGLSTDAAIAACVIESDGSIAACGMDGGRWLKRGGEELLRADEPSAVEWPGLSDPWQTGG